MMHPSTRQLDSFLASVEQKALRIAQFSCRNPDEGFDLLQDAMIRFVERYADRPEEEWKPLFYRILRNRITDGHRRESVRSRLFRWLPGSGGESRADPLEALPGPEQDNPERSVQTSTAMETLRQALKQLPEQQRQTFLLRQWEGMSVRETARAMDISEGSVKTHYSRAVRSLQHQLEGIWP